MLVKIASALAITGQNTVLVDLPDLPGIVVRVWRVMIDLQSFSVAAAIVHTLSHDVNLGVTLSTNDVAGQWIHVEQAHGAAGLGQPHIEVPFLPEPLELIGPQRWDILPGAGTITTFLTVHYTLRPERNVTEWNLLRARTSHERD